MSYLPEGVREFRSVVRHGVGKYYVPVNMLSGQVYYIHTKDLSIKELSHAELIFFDTEELAEEAIKEYNKVIRIGGE